MNSDLPTIARRFAEHAEGAFHCGSAFLEHAVQFLLMALALFFIAIGWVFAWIENEFHQHRLNQRLQRVNEKIHELEHEVEDLPVPAPLRVMSRGGIAPFNCLLPFTAIPLLHLSNVRIIVGLILLVFAVSAFLFATLLVAAGKLADRQLERDALIPNPSGDTGASKPKSLKPPQWCVDAAEQIFSSAIDWNEGRKSFDMENAAWTIYRNLLRSQRSHLEAR
jgi:hypothetical protein